MSMEFQGHVIKVCLDTSAIKHATYARETFFRHFETVTWGGQSQVIELALPGTRVPWLRIGDEEFRHEVLRLRIVGEAARSDLLSLYRHQEVEVETLGVTVVGGGIQGWFDGIEIEAVENPFQYGRTILGGGLTPEQHALTYFSNIRDPRYDEMKRVCNVRPQSKKCLNDLIDAFHLFCADQAGMDYFLTLDRRLVNKVNNARKPKPNVKVVMPSRLLSVIEGAD